MSTLDLTCFPPAIAELLRPSRLVPLDAGQPNEAVRAQLQALADDAFAPQGVKDRGMASACRAGLWLYHDFLDEAHTIAQDLDTTEGSYWHAILHRREPDPSNAAYWFRRVGAHPVLKLLRERAPALGYEYTDPFAFVDFVERVRDTDSEEEETAKRVQQLEWELLFDHCYRAAI